MGIDDKTTEGIAVGDLKNLFFLIFHLIEMQMQGVNSLCIPPIQLFGHNYFLFTISIHVFIVSFLQCVS